MTEFRYATVHYRRLVRELAAIDDTQTLSGAIAQALDRPHPHGGHYRDDWRHRLVPSPDDADLQRLTNNVHTNAESAFGNLFAFTRGELQALIAADAGRGGPSADVSETTAPGQNDYLKGIAYWLAIGDHCYIVQHVAVRTRSLEEYLTWLLRDATRTIGDEGRVVLQAAFDVASVGGDLDNLESVEIGGLIPETNEDADGDPLFDIVGVGEDGEVDERRTLGRQKASFGSARRILSELVGDLRADRIIAEIPPEAALEVMVNFGYRARRRGIGRAAMNELATSLRNIEDGEVKVRAKDGRRRGNQVWLQDVMRFRRMRENGNLLDLDSVREQLSEVHRRFLQDGKIS